MRYDSLGFRPVWEGRSFTSQDQIRRKLRCTCEYRRDREGRAMGRSEILTVHGGWVVPKSVPKKWATHYQSHSSMFLCRLLVRSSRLMPETVVVLTPTSQNRLTALAHHVAPCVQKLLWRAGFQGRCPR